MVEITYQMVLSTLQTAGILVGIVYYIITLRNQRKNQEISLRNQELTLKSQELSLKVQQQAVETRQAQLFMQVISHWSQPSMTESRVYYSNLEITSVEDYAKLFRSPDTGNKLRMWGAYLEGLGVLVRENYLDIKFIARLIGGVVKSDWEKQVPYVYEFREKNKAPRAWIEWEYLYDELMKYAETHPELGIQKSEYQVLGHLEG